MLIVYITCANQAEAEEIAGRLLSKKLCGCVNILPGAASIYFWPENSQTIEKSSECILFAKTFEDKFEEIEKEVGKMHTYEIPCIIGIPALYASARYEEWLKRAMGEAK
jgi:periplasmic divalent cation tolerance protein